LNWKSADETIECVRSCQQLAYAEREIVVIDNGSDDGSEERLRGELPDLTLIQTGANLGYAGGNNVGFDYALSQGAKYVLVLNNDTRVDPGMLEELIGVFEENSRAGMVSPIVFSGTDGDRIWYAGTLWDERNMTFKRQGDGEALGDHHCESSPYPTLSAAGCGFLIRADVLRALGGFDEDFFLYWEEMDLSSRVLQAGYQILVAPKARMWHIVGETFRSLGPTGAATAAYYKTRNSLLWARKHLSGSSHRKFMYRILPSILPRIECSWIPQTGELNRAYWKLRECLKAYLTSHRDPRFRAALQGIRDFRRGRFGPRPDS
jgi:GT2 family glycosyltransferase